MTAIERVLATAEKWVGYLEKSRAEYNKDHSIVYEMTAGAGRDNYTMVWEDVKPAFQGQPWCQGFIFWIFYKTFGADLAKRVLYLDDWKGFDSWSNYACFAWADNFERHGARYQSSKAKVGDIIYFTKSHTGIVYKIADGYVYTIEGNTSVADAVVSNGGGVYRKKYKLGIDAIYCYGRPNYAIAEEVKPTEETADVTLKVLEKGVTPKKTREIYTFQILMEYYGYYGMSIDGSYGNGSKTACERFQKDAGLPVTGICDEATWKALLTM